MWIRAMVVPHATELDRMPSFTAKTEPLAGGIRLAVVARKPDDPKLVARIRGLGFAGLMTEGAHDQAHHLKTRDLLTDEQRRLYHEARWSAHRPMGPHGAGSPGAGAPMK